MRIDLTDTTFIIPVRIDSMIRLENLLMSVDSIVRYFRTRIFWRPHHTKMRLSPR